jgi:hypothetical protein
MRSSELHPRILFALKVGAVCLFTFVGNSRARAQVQGFALDRFYSAPAGGGWLVMDSLDMHRGLGGAIELTSEYAHNPLVVNEGSQHLAVVTNDAVVDLGLAVTYDRFRLSLNLTSPVAVVGHGGTVGTTEFTGPNFDLGQDPDTLSDARLGFDARLYGAPGGPLRVGASAQLFFPSGTRENYITDGTYRAMFRALLAGDTGWFTWAGQLGVHVRPLDEPDFPGGPRGSELLFGVGAGARLHAGDRWEVVIGPELYGQTAYKAFLGQTTTGVEGLLSARLEGTGPGIQARVKLGAGGGLDPNFGAPEWRVVLAIEMFNGGGTPKSTP